jgi:5-methylcytosine-specific restriction endonuclease McrA
VKLCWFCGIAMTEKGPRPKAETREHLTPKVRGGSHGRSQVVRACRACNLDKGHLTLEEYRLVVAYRNGLVQTYETALRFHGELAAQGATA